MNTQQRNELNRIVKAMVMHDVAGGLSQVTTLLELIALSKSYVRLQEQACNVGLTHRQTVRETNIEIGIIDRALILELDARFEGDPRGFCVWLTKEEGSGETHKIIDVVGIA